MMNEEDNILELLQKANYYQPVVEKALSV